MRTEYLTNELYTTTNHNTDNKINRSPAARDKNTRHPRGFGAGPIPRTRDGDTTSLYCRAVVSNFKKIISNVKGFCSFVLIQNEPNNQG